ncbi:hypothetical protein LTR04_002770 [Oleoguttula sp. CCFEE 6159]|nr:hypothetical protein LTR04_002770 [Oleoguttula sp. CCFEE 6159]
MSGTPRLRSAFPSTPQTGNRQHATSPRFSNSNSSLPDVAGLTSLQEPNAPLIPFETIDAPSQRLYVAAFYVALVAWHCFDLWHLFEEDTESLWLFMKWIAIDGIFLFGLPALRIPWLEWSSTTTTILFLVHALTDGIMMFRIPIPLLTGLVALSKLFYDRELAIIHILPEGSAVLNPANEAFCLDASSKSSVTLPIHINQTTPTSIELLRVDLDTATEETIKISEKEARRMRKEAEKDRAHEDPDGPLVLRYTAKRTGLYILQRVVDESKLDVQRRRTSNTVVVACPKAQVKIPGSNRCRNELSNVVLEVEGTPPLKIRYRNFINDVEREASFQSIQPDDFVSPLTRQGSDAAVLRGSKDISWARSQKIMVPINETLTTSGKWMYWVDEVQDAYGNTVTYTDRDHQSSEGWRHESSHLQQAFVVHERPRVELENCSSQRPLKVAKGVTISLPVQYSSTGKRAISDSPYTLKYLFTPEAELSPNGEHAPTAQTKEVTLKNTSQKPGVQHSGLYTLTSVSTEFCEGEVLEPASCLLENPPEPELSLSTEEIFDKCAGNPIGLRVDLDVMGTPPFTILYKMQRKGDSYARLQSEQLRGLRGQLELTPPEAGHYTYTFTEISDDVYKGRSLDAARLTLEQDVKPSASAHFADSSPTRQICLDEAVSFKVKLQGQQPFILEYELVHGGKRTKHKTESINLEEYAITTGKLKNGGDYSLALVSVTDAMGCKEFLKDEAKISVRHSRPLAKFGQLENKRMVKTLEGKKISLPVRLAGVAPWTVQYRKLEDPAIEREIKLQKDNDVLDIDGQGTYEITEVKDKFCPGTIDESASRFEVRWIPRPQLRILEGSSVTFVEDKYVKKDVCEGEEDLVELGFSGTPPYVVKYEEHHKPEYGAKSLRTKELNAALGIASVQMDTSQAGRHEYKFVQLGDYNYDHDPRKYSPLLVQQHVNSRPTAQFTTPGKTYSYCSVETSGEEVIPMTLKGVPPFNLEVEIRHHGSSKAETYREFNIKSTTHSLRIPHRLLHLGNSALEIRKVRDANGCTRRTDPNSPLPRVHISVHEPPSIRPLESQEHFCVGDRISYALSGQPPFNVFYNFEGVERKAAAPSTTFRRIAEKPGVFTITAVKDSASECKAYTSIEKFIHEMPSVRVSKGREEYVDIHEGGEAEILFEFGGTPPFEFTYTRSTNERKGKKSQVLETKSEVSHEHSMRIRASLEGTYEVVAIKDRYCAYAKPGQDLGKGQKLLKY